MASISATQRHSHATALFFCLLVSTGEAHRLSAVVGLDIHTSAETEAKTNDHSFSVGQVSRGLSLKTKGASSGSQVRAKAVDPFFLATAVGLSTLANIANVVLHHVRISRMEGTRTELISVQEQIFSERADACFSVRSLEVQADLLSRAIEAFVQHTGAALQDSLLPGSSSDVGANVSVTIVANETTVKAISTDIAQISESLTVVSNQLRRAMAAAVQTACHSSSSGEILLQANVDELSRQIEEAQTELMNAGMHLVSDLTAGIVNIANGGTSLDKAFDDPRLDSATKSGNVALNSIVGLGQLSAGKWTVPEGISEGTWKAIVSGLGVMWTTATVISMVTRTAAAIDAVVNFNYLLQSLFNLVKGQSKGFDAAMEVLTIVNSILSITNDVIALSNPLGTPIPGLMYVTLTISTVTSILRLAKTAIQMQREQGQHAEMIAQAHSTINEVRLLRSFGTCNSLGTAWELSKTAGTFMAEAEIAGAVFDDAAMMARVYERYLEDRPSLAAAILREALKEGTPGVTETLVRKAEKLAKQAPVTDFAVAVDRQQMRALGALGFRPATTRGRGARFLICRGCADSIIAGMTIVKDDDMFKKLRSDFNSAPAVFGELELPTDSTLNFVQLPRGEGFSMLAFAKVPQSALTTQPVPVLFDMKEEMIKIEADKLSSDTVEDWRGKAMELLRDNGATVLAWKAHETHRSSGDRWAHSMVSDHQGDEHWDRKEFGKLELLQGLFLRSSPEQVDEDKPLQSLVPAGLLRPSRYVTVTKGCGCSMGPLHNPYRAGALEKVVKHVEAFDSGDDQDQELRCRWRYDFWLSEAPLDTVSTTDHPMPAGGGRSPSWTPMDDGLGCALVTKSAELATPVEDPSQLVIVTGYPMEDGVSWGYEFQDLYGIGPQFPGSARLFGSRDAEHGAAWPLEVLGEDGGVEPLPWEIWSKPPKHALKFKTGASPGTHQMVHDFQDHVGAVLCSNSCAFKDKDDIRKALTKVLKMEYPAAVAEQRFKGKPRGVSKECRYVKDVLMPNGFPTSLAEYSANGLGKLIAGDSEDAIDQNLFKRILQIYKEDCDFEATMLLTPMECDKGFMPDLRVGPRGAVEEVCVPAAIGSSDAAPLHQYAVTFDLQHHEKKSMKEQEKIVEEGLQKAGFVRWGATLLWTDDKWNTDTWWWRRSLRQKVFVQRDPRVITAKGAEVCAA